ncbi:MAG: hypothetical protein AAB368_12335, partial [bacterium]
NDSDNAMNFSLINFSVDTTLPVVELILPADSQGYTSNSQSIDFSYNVTETNIANCSLIVSSTIRDSDTSILTDGSANTFTYALTPGTYFWSV